MVEKPGLELRDLVLLQPEFLQARLQVHDFVAIEVPETHSNQFETGWSRRDVAD